MRTLALCALLVMASSGIAADGAFKLQWKPQVGEIHVYHVTVRFDYGTGMLDFESDLQLKVLAVNPNGTYKVQTTTSNAVAQSGTDKQTLEQQPPREQIYSADGSPLVDKPASRSTDPFSDLLNHLTELQTPPHAVKVGDSWLNRPVGPKQSFFGEPRISYRLSDVIKSGSKSFAKVSYSATVGLDKQAATGNVLLSRPANALFRLDARINHFKPEGATADASVDIVVQEK